MSKREKIVAGNWKLNGSHAFAKALVSEVSSQLADVQTKVIILPPSTYIDRLVQDNAHVHIHYGAQDVSEHASGAYTGEISAAMLVDIGARYTLVGHSERRQYHQEDNDTVARKLVAAQQVTGLTPILCLGETREQREAGETKQILSEQLSSVIRLAGIDAFKNAILAYEPVWAIGTGLTASPEQAQDVHHFLRSEIAQHSDTIAQLLPILYGGSCKPDNAETLFAQDDIDGGLIGGASLKAADFLSIIRACKA